MDVKTSSFKLCKQISSYVFARKEPKALREHLQQANTRKFDSYFQPASLMLVLWFVVRLLYFLSDSEKPISLVMRPLLFGVPFLALWFTMIRL